VNCAASEVLPLRVGWAEVDITPEEPVNLHGQLRARVSEGVLDPLTATVLALASGEDATGAAILVSCDLCVAADSLRDAVRAEVASACPELAAESVVLNATHTHTGPTAFVPEDLSSRDGAEFPADEVELPVMAAADYVSWAAGRIAGAAIEAWRTRSPASVGYGLGQAVVGRNRRVAYRDGSSRMYGDTSQETFSHVEGWEDHDLNLLATYDAGGALTGLVVNVACPSQLAEAHYLISADFWHDVRVELRQRLGAGIFILPQCSAAGDQSPRRLWGKAAEKRMLRLSGRSARAEIAHRIADAVESVLPHVSGDRRSELVLTHRAEEVPLARWKTSEEEVRRAESEAVKYRREYERLLGEIDSNPHLRDQPRWYSEVTGAFAMWRFNARVRMRAEACRSRPQILAELHVIRLGEVVLATNPFECFLDYGVQIKARSPATQTFLVQLAGPGSYLPTARSVGGSGYGAAPSSSLVGPEGGGQLVEWTVAAIREAFASDAKDGGSFG